MVVDGEMLLNKFLINLTGAFYATKDNFRIIVYASVSQSWVYAP